MKLAQPLEWKRLVVLNNPASTFASPAKKRIAQLEQTFPGKVLVLQTKKDLGENTRQLEEHIQDTDIIVVAGGDGTVNQTIHSLGNQPVPLLPLGNGNANDLAVMLYGNKVAEPLYILDHARVVALHPLECTIQPDEGPAATYLAACYASFGSSAHAAAYINQSSMRARHAWNIPGGKYLGDLDIVLHTLRTAKPFKIAYKNTEQTTLDIIICNGSRMARTWRFPSHIEKQDMFVALIKDKQPLHIAQNTVHLLRGTLPGEHVHGKATTFRILSPTNGQVDGEPFSIETPCTVSVSHAAQPFYALTLQPAAAAN